ncbi:hypothetical protein K438DRAFT_746617 [Mycena galopus ATCC 62051]|nr:hypothetical protein K438DRAFT_746617 [Mycena galopus ATCC 62051]
MIVLTLVLQQKPAKRNLTLIPRYLESSRTTYLHITEQHRTGVTSFRFWKKAYIYISDSTMALFAKRCIHIPIHFRFRFRFRRLASPRLHKSDTNVVAHSQYLFRSLVAHPRLSSRRKAVLAKARHTQLSAHSRLQVARVLPSADWYWGYPTSQTPPKIHTTIANTCPYIPARAALSATRTCHQSAARRRRFKESGHRSRPGGVDGRAPLGWHSDGIDSVHVRRSGHNIAISQDRGA